MKNSVSLAALLSLLVLGSCLIRPEEVVNPWTNVLGFEINTPIKTMFTDGLQLSVASDNEYLRIGTGNTLIERRPLPLPYRFFNRPAMGRFCFTRVVRKEAQGNPVVELRMNNNPDFVLDLDFNELGGTNNLGVFPEEDSRYSGAFNEQGDLLLLPGVNITENQHDFYLIRLTFDPTGNTISNTNVLKVGIPEIPAAFGSISNVEYINGNFYIISLDGAYRITEQGDYVKLFQTHLWDFYNADGKFFAADRGGRLYQSIDNGLSWLEIDENVVVQAVETAGDFVLTHQANGFPFSICSSDFKEKTELLLNADFPLDFAAYRQVVLFDNKFYLNVQKELYSASQLLEVEE